MATVTRADVPPSGEGPLRTLGRRDPEQARRRHGRPRRRPAASPTRTATGRRRRPRSADGDGADGVERRRPGRPSGARSCRRRSTPTPERGSSSSQRGRVVELDHQAVARPATPSVVPGGRGRRRRRRRRLQPTPAARRRSTDADDVVDAPTPSAHRVAGADRRPARRRRRRRRRSRRRRSRCHRRRPPVAARRRRRATPPPTSGVTLVGADPAADGRRRSGPRVAGRAAARARRPVELTRPVDRADPPEPPYARLRRWRRTRSRRCPGSLGRRPRVRRVTRVVRHVDPWSVFKVAIVFNLVLYVVLLTAGVLLWNVAYATGTVDNLERFFESFGWATFEFNGGEIFHSAWIAGLFVVVGLTGARRARRDPVQPDHRPRRRRPHHRARGGGRQSARWRRCAASSCAARRRRTPATRRSGLRRESDRLPDRTSRTTTRAGSFHDRLGAIAQSVRAHP